MNTVLLALLAICLFWVPFTLFMLISRTRLNRRLEMARTLAALKLELQNAIRFEMRNR